MIRDRFTFAVFVGCQIQLAGALQRRFQFAQNLATSFGDFVVGHEVVLYVDLQTRLRKVGDVTDGCEHYIVATQQLGNGLRLSGGLNDDKWS